MAAIFEAQDLSYAGPERRGYHRRQKADRRNSIRFEPDNPDRRQSSGRRKSDLSGWNRSDF
ncbi:hypothetical protein BTA51_10005 [Hahella sp. CCB-MM4]|uniref:hypothetical protein n=1 Tax=Hahella sp. (strain CCB-MM4) TaxID=1926491 RepID=UPI000B9A757D|nr:hypothetical protein [Hahella sp. CCB-MM4]OZG73357.1 hypothetical protein BTA51_10005 [Hahella sp. CCB-MM4]